MKHFFATLIFSFAFINCSVSAKSQIFDGDVVSTQDFPFVGLIYRLPAITTCTATLIDKQWVLTASHCVSGEEPGEIFPPESVEFKLDGNLKVKAQKIFTYNPQGLDLDYDVALVKLAQPLPIQPVAIPKTNDNAFIKSQDVIPVGYGSSKIEWIQYNDPQSCPQYGLPCYRFNLSGDGKLRKGLGVILSDTEIKTKIKQCIEFGDLIEITYNPATMLGMYSPNGQHALPGDSGGPLLIQTPQGYMQIGITSWGPRLAGDGGAKEYREIDKQQIEEHVKMQPIFYANLLNKDILRFIYSTMRNE